MCTALVGSLPATHGWSGDRETGYEMSDLEEREVERPGIDRRTLIKRTAVAGAVAWTAPAIIGSLASPAGAVTGGLPASCSYASIVVKTGSTICAVKVVTGGTTCTNDNTTSSDSTFTTTCNDGTGGTQPVTYSNTGAGSNNPISRGTGGTVTAVPACSGPCPVTVNGGTITANAGSTILFAIGHSGSCSGGPGDKFCAPCCNVTSCAVGC
jgi:hypothetical protein